MVSSAVKVDLGELIEKLVLLCPIQALHRINDFHDRAHDQKKTHLAGCRKTDLPFPDNHHSATATPTMTSEIKIGPSTALVLKKSTPATG